MNPSALIAQADCFRIPLPDKSVHCCVTSPPYWGLRKYSGNQGDEPLGLEPTPERHIERTVQWAREVYRVLRDDGVFFCNYGDCYAGSGGENNNGGLGSTLTGTARPITDDGSRSGLWRRNPRQECIAQGNLMLMPHRVALALQADGWIVRQDLVWSKPNPMPESVAGWRWQKSAQLDPTIYWGIPTNVPADLPDGGSVQHLRRGSFRHTRSHEYVFMLTKQMQYFADGEAVKERLALPDAADSSRTFGGSSKHGANLQHGKRTTGRAYDVAPTGRNPRSVLHIPTAPYRGAHYATFPPALIAPLILATCPRWCCPVCGQGWAPVVENHWKDDGRKHDDGYAIAKRMGYLRLECDDNDGFATRVPPGTVNADITVLGHRPTCNHSHTQAEAVPGIVCDPFVGSGTTVMVAKQLLRRGIGFDLSLEYLDQQASLRTGASSRSGQLDNLPLFARDETEP